MTALISLHPEPTEFSWLMVAFMVFAILLKGSQALFTIATGKHINSLPVIAAGTDNRNDVLTSIIIVCGMLIHHFTGIDLDGYMGCLVSIFILVSGIQLILKTVSPLLGEPPNQEMIDEMREIILKQPEVLNTHGIVIYNYGPGRTFASFHAEVDSRNNIMDVHTVIDQIERELKEKLNIDAAGHMDPIVVDDPIRIRIEEILNDTIPHIDGVQSFHDVRIMPRKDHLHIVFDIVMEPEAMEARDEIEQKLTEVITAENDNYQVIINFDQSYV